MVAIARQPSTESDADKLSDHIQELTSHILKRLAYADGKPIDSVEDPNDGRMRIVD